MQVENLISPSVKPIAEPQVKPAASDDGFSFDDFLDVINPLQHLPVVGMVYRAITGDEIKAPAKIAGDALFGGIYGFLGALGSVAYEGIVGESIEKTVMSLFDSDTPAAPAQALAQRAYQSAQTLSLDEIERSPFYGTVRSPVSIAALEL
ncbi:MAG: hypothetical protein ABL973_05165 [Micropepsaceae bacterium]